MARYEIRNGETRGTELALAARDRLFVAFGGGIDVRGPGTALRIADATASVRNEGNLYAGDYGILSVVGAGIFNSGNIRGSVGVQFDGDDGVASLRNTGRIGGISAIVTSTTIDLRNSGYVESGSGNGITAAGGTIVNGDDAVITSASGAYGILSNSDSAFHIINRGRIHGQSGAISLTGDADDRVVNSGELQTGNGSVPLDTSAGDDRVRNTGTILGRVYLGAGDDVMHNDAASVGTTIYGGDGDDRIRGGSVQTFMVGGAGRDQLTGGTGQDVFMYLAITDSLAPATQTDRIHDYDPLNDVIVLKSIDADTLIAGDQAFHLVGDAAFSGTAGELRIETHRHHLMILADVDGDGSADFAIKVVGTVDPASLQFLL